ncbi:MAG TPA: cation:proton antiporter [Candidatus Methanoperedenaceae archaeon]|nr:cation:proton antiporter [Candidatus Methanoperedenaceae archaeon]
MVQLYELAAVYLAVSVGGLVAIRLGQSVIPAYMLAGMAIGPYGLALLRDEILIKEISQLGLILLLLFLGLEFSVGGMLKSGKRMVVAGTVDLLVNFPIGVLLGMAFGWDLLTSMFLGGIVYISSSGIVTKLLTEFRMLANPETETILGIMVYEDVFVAVYMAVISGIAISGAGGGGDIAAVIAKALIFCIAIVFVARKLNGAVTRLLDIENDELFLLFLFGIVVLVSAAAMSIGMSEAIGAFLVGLVFAETAHIQRIKAKIIPLRDLFAAIFFMFFGMGIDYRGLGGVIGIVAIAVLVSIAGKLVTGMAAARACGMSSREGMNIGTCTIARGEFSLALANVAAGAVLPVFTGAYVLGLSILAPLIMKITRRM